MGEGLSIPRTAVMQTGKRSLVYIAMSENRFEPREIRVGMELDGDKLEVLEGLKAGERLVASPEFLLDSESRLRLLNRKFATPPMPNHSESPHHETPGMDMPGTDMPGVSKDSMKASKSETEHEMHKVNPSR